MQDHWDREEMEEIGREAGQVFGIFFLLVISFIAGLIVLVSKCVG